jgi:hypothetical protein
MAFFYGLVSQRGPFKETAVDYIRLTDPQYNQAVDPNTTNIVNTKELRLQQKTSGKIGLSGGDKPFTKKTTINGVEASLGLTNELVNVYVSKALDAGFTSGADGGLEVTEAMANFLNTVRQSTTYNYAVPILERGLRERFENIKNSLSLPDLKRLHLVIHQKPFDVSTASEILLMNAKNASLRRTMSPEMASAKVRSEASSSKVAQAYEQFENGEYTVPSAENLVILKAASVDKPVTPSAPTPSAPGPSAVKPVLEDTPLIRSPTDIQMEDLLPQQPAPTEMLTPYSAPPPPPPPTGATRIPQAAEPNSDLLKRFEKRKPKVGMDKQLQDEVAKKLAARRRKMRDRSSSGSSSRTKRSP